MVWMGQCVHNNLAMNAAACKKAPNRLQWLGYLGYWHNTCQYFSQVEPACWDASMHWWRTAEPWLNGDSAEETTAIVLGSHVCAGNRAAYWFMSSRPSIGSRTCHLSHLTIFYKSLGAKSWWHLDLPQVACQLSLSNHWEMPQKHRVYVGPTSNKLL